MQLIKMTLVGGFLVLLPLLLLYMLLAEVMGLVIALATPIADLIGIEEIRYPELLAILLLVGGSLLIGVLMHLPLAQRVGGSVEDKVMSRMPIWIMLRSVSKAFLQVDENGAFRSGLLRGAEGDGELVYVVEDDGSELLTVFLPWSPATFAGTIKVVARDRVTLLSASLGDVTRAIGSLGVGSLALLPKGSEQGEGTPIESS